MYLTRHVTLCCTNKVPDTVKSLNNVWLETYQTSMTVVGIFVGVEFSLLIFIKSDSSFQRSSSIAKQVLLASAYCGLFFSLSAAVTALILSNKLGKIIAQTPQEKDGDTPDSPRGYEGRTLLTCMTWHWMFSLIGGIILLIAQVLLYVWTEESNVIRIALSITTVFAVLPLAFLIPLPSGSGRHHSIIHT